MSQLQWLVVAYDVANERRLRRVATLLEGYGVRAQYSLFRCLLTKAQASKLCHELSRVISREDKVIVMPMCGECVARVRMLGFGHDVSWSVTGDRPLVI